MAEPGQPGRASGGRHLSLLSFVFRIFSKRIVRFLGQNGLNVVTRLMGLILAVIGMQMLIDGIIGAFSIGQ